MIKKNVGTPNHSFIRTLLRQAPLVPAQFRMPDIVLKWKMESPSTLLWSAAPVKKKEIIDSAENNAIIAVINPTIKCVTSLVKNRKILEDSPA